MEPATERQEQRGERRPGRVAGVEGVSPPGIPADLPGDDCATPAAFSMPGRLLWCGVWLVFLAYPVSDIVSHPHPVGWTLAAWGALAVFVGLYLRTMWIALQTGFVTGEQPGAPWLAALIAFTFGTIVAFGASWGGMTIYLGVATGSTLRLRPALVTLAALVVATAGFGLGDHAGYASIAFMCFMVASLGVTMLGIRRMVRLIADLQHARSEVARLVAADERLRISRDLHDVLGHSLSVIALKSQVARRTLATDVEQAGAALADIEGVARRSLGDVRALVSEYRQRSLAEELTISGELFAAAGIELDVRRVAAVPAGDGDRLLSWALREGTTNVIRHSRATRCTVTVRVGGGCAELEMADDGTGPSGSASDGTGLRGLAERMREAGGELASGPGPGGGFVLAVRLPLAGP